MHKESLYPPKTGTYDPLEFMERQNSRIYERVAKVETDLLNLKEINIEMKNTNLREFEKINISINKLKEDIDTAIESIKESKFLTIKLACALAITSLYGKNVGDLILSWIQ